MQPPAVPSPCPCGSRQDFERCCGPLLRGEREAATPLELMRSRYSAYARQEIDYLLRTHHPSRCTEADRLPITEWARSVVFTGLSILAAPPVMAGAQRGEVSFIAKFRDARGQVQSLREHSIFVHEGGRWYYLEGR